MSYFEKAYFVFDDNSQYIVDIIESNDFGTVITPLHVEVFLENIASLKDEIEHVVVSISHENISNFLSIAFVNKFSVGIVPSKKDKYLIKNLFCSSDINENIKVALSTDCKGIDLVKIDSKLMYTQALIGTVPLINKPLKKRRSSFYKRFLHGIKDFFYIHLQRFEIDTQNGRKIITAGSAIIIFNHSRNSIISRIFNFDESMRDGKITIVIISPFSIFEYLKLIFLFFTKKPI